MSMRISMKQTPTKAEIKQICDQRFSPETYKKLQRAAVAIAGLGGLGSNIAVMLTRSGIGRLKLVDFDKVDLSNLNRQAYHICHLGKKKTEALAELLQEINPYMELETIDRKVTEENAASLFQGYRYVCEAFDDPSAKAMLAEQILTSTQDTYLISGSGMAGYSNANAIRTRKVNDRFYICGDESTDLAEGMGLMAPRVAICAGHQANKVIQLILQEHTETDVS
jgi:sulfur carrier protein ThiS adenylyltransferase